MNPITSVTLIMVSLIALAGVAVWFAYLLVVSGHPGFAVVSGCFALAALIACTDVKVKQQ